MSKDQQAWLSLSEASEQLGVHPTTLRRWADAGQIPCFRTPGGHRRFRNSDLAAWMQGQRGTDLVPQPEALVQSAVGFARQEMAEHGVSRESWYTAFELEEDRQQMRDTGRRLFGLAIQYMSRTRNHESILKEGQRIGSFYGQASAQHGVSLVDMVRALFFFRESLLRAARPGQANPGQYDAEDVRIHRQLRYFMDEVMYACLASYEATCRRLLSTGSLP
jgi:excisionase family DNA binding protein